jgi:hypothetical protein
MTKFYLLFATVILLTSCSPRINYLGNSFQPTSNVDVYVDEGAISKDYTIMGKGYVRAYSYSIPESVQRKAITKAKQKGADAVLFKDYFVPVVSSATRSKKDSSGGISVSVNHTMPASVSAEMVVLFLKYK